MRDAAALAVGVAALAASVAIALAAEATPGDMVSVPAGPYRPFLHVTAPGASSGDAWASGASERFGSGSGR